MKLSDVLPALKYAWISFNGPLYCFKIIHVFERPSLYRLDKRKDMEDLVAFIDKSDGDLHIFLNKVPGIFTGVTPQMIRDLITHHKLYGEDLLNQLYLLKNLTE